MAFSKKSYNSGAKEYILYTGEEISHTVASNAIAAGNVYSTLPIDVSGKKFQFMIKCTTAGADDLDLGVSLEGSIDGTNWVTVVADGTMSIDVAGTATTDIDTVLVDCSSASFPHWRFNTSNQLIGSGGTDGTTKHELQMAVEVSDNMSMVAGDFGGIGVDPS